MTDSSQAVENHRLDAFVDAAFAFAVTLLIIAGAEPLSSFDDLVTALLRIPAFLAGFALLMLFWLAHRNWASLEPKRDGVTTALSLAVVFVILIYVFPLRLLMETALHFMSGGYLPGSQAMRTLGQLAWTYFFYGLGFAVLSGLFAALYLRAGPGDGTAERRLAVRSWARTWAVAAASGVLSGLVALTPLLAAAPWLPGVIYWLIPLSVMGFGIADKRALRGPART